MQRFDKGYIYYSLLTDFFGSLAAVVLLLGEFLSDGIKVKNLVGTVLVFVGIFLAIYLCLTVYRILYYRTSGYELTETEIKCNRGVFFRKRSVVDYGKIHAVNKKQNLFHRIFHIAVLTVDSGSANTSHQAEITVVERDGVVDILISKLNRLKESGIPCNINGIENRETVFSDKDSLYSFTSKKKMLYTSISVASTAFFTTVLGALLAIVIGVCKLILKQNFLGTWGQYFMFSALIMAGAILLFSFVSFVVCIIYSFVAYYRFTVTKNESNIQISFGLLEKHTNTFSYDRIKAVKISQSLLQRFFGFATIRLEVIGYTGNDGNADTQIGVLVPFCKYGEIKEILGKILPDYTPDEKQSRTVSLFPFVSWFLLIFGIITGITLLLAVTVMLILNVAWPIICAVAFSILGVGIAVVALKMVSAILAYRINGLAINSGKITAYGGSFTKTVTVFMARNLVSVENITTPLRNKNGIASLVMHLKTNDESNELKVHIQKDELFEELIKLLIL